jgi:hypothetical protein
MLGNSGSFCPEASVLILKWRGADLSVLIDSLDAWLDDELSENPVNEMVRRLISTLK